jgi:hypothetical protein
MHFLHKYPRVLQKKKVRGSLYSNKRQMEDKKSKSELLKG